MAARTLHRLALAATVLTVLAVATVSAQLADGPVEIASHWWSTLAVAVPAIAAAGLWMAARR